MPKKVVSKKVAKKNVKPAKVIPAKKKPVKEEEDADEEIDTDSEPEESETDEPADEEDSDEVDNDETESTDDTDSESDEDSEEESADEEDDSESAEEEESTDDDEEEEAPKSASPKKGRDKDGYYFDKKLSLCIGPDVVTPFGRAQFVKLSKPGTTPEGKKQWSVTVCFSKKDAANIERLKRVKMAAFKCLVKKYGSKERVPSVMKVYVQDGDTSDLRKDYEGFKGAFFVQANTKNECPLILDNEEQRIDPSEIKGGMIVQAVINPIAHKSGLSWGLSAVRLAKDDGKRFGRKVDTSSMFKEDVDEANEADEDTDTDEF
jgi:hypothetical protein